MPSNTATYSRFITILYYTKPWWLALSNERKFVDSDQQSQNKSDSDILTLLINKFKWIYEGQTWWMCIILWASMSNNNLATIDGTPPTSQLWHSHFQFKWHHAHGCRAFSSTNSWTTCEHTRQNGENACFLKSNEHRKLEEYARLTFSFHVDAAVWHFCSTAVRFVDVSTCIFMIRWPCQNRPLAKAD